MSDPTESADPIASEQLAWDDPEWCEPSSTRDDSDGGPITSVRLRAILPERRKASEAAVEARQEGLRIEPRPGIRLPDDEGPPAQRRIEVTEHGRGVIRLESETTPAILAQMEQLPPLHPRNSKSSPKPERYSAEWGKTGTRSNRWLWWSGAAVVVVVLLCLVMDRMLVKKESGRSTADGYQSLQVVDDLVAVGDPLVYFSENPAQVITEIQQALATYARARTLDEAIPVIRHGDALRGPLTRLWRPWGVPRDWEVSNEDAVSYDSVGKVPYAIVSGTLPDFSPYRVFLVRENNRMLIDWEATLGLGSRTFDELKNPEVVGAELRVILSPVEFYTESFPENRFRAYRLGFINGEDFLWGYVERNSPAARALEEIFNETAVFSDKPREQAMRIRVKRAVAGAAPNQWLVLDVLHKGWVSP